MSSEAQKKGKENLIYFLDENENITGISLLELWRDKTAASQLMKVILKPGLLVQPLVLSRTPILPWHLLVKILINLLSHKRKKKGC